MRKRPSPPVEPVEDPDAIAALQEPGGKDAPDIAGTAGHEDELPRLRRLGRQAIAAACEPRRLEGRASVVAHVFLRLLRTKSRTDRSTLWRYRFFRVGAPETDVAAAS